MIKFLALSASLLTIAAPAAAMEKVWPVYLGKDGYGDSIRLISNDGSSCHLPDNLRISGKCEDYGVVDYLSGSGSYSVKRRAYFACPSGKLMATQSIDRGDNKWIDAYPKSAPFQAMALISCAAVADSR
jgi:hypothetical protein